MGVIGNEGIGGNRESDQRGRELGAGNREPNGGGGGRRSRCWVLPLKELGRRLHRLRVVAPRLPISPLLLDHATPRRRPSRDRRFTPACIDAQTPTPARLRPPTWRARAACSARRRSSTATTTCRGPSARTTTAPRDVEAYDLRKTTPGHTDLARLKQGMVGAQFWSVYIPGEIKDSGYARVQLEQIDIARRVIAKYPERFELGAHRGRRARAPSRRARSARCSAWRAATRSRTRSARCAPTTTSARAT